MSVEHINSLLSFNKFISSHPNVLVDFFATWCGPCKMIAPYFEELARTNPSIKFVKVDVDQGADIAQRYGVHSMPTFILFKNGQEYDRFSGANRAKLQEFCQSPTRTFPVNKISHRPSSNSSLTMTLVMLVLIFIGFLIIKKLIN
ncbi:thioredoxin-1, putative [Entamoeba dispar SAW760]|uniref:Thioredoxin-1, putative n=1 Tax=Entamoeba dispar (strain ATCC PRA-260 / SAW760) TaxID=370354 RepID=B0ERJ7_ENTDS|nr:thioredoxin-1, putative [Entamoeba dispar SAW760]EDR22855.1 thioredoxin-1, putative [Entamoeba dispar SAW760]|eukprot:EDR22855.1 thioredoxin-1, putative [Entamoeba dispar SAW760]